MTDRQSSAVPGADRTRAEQTPSVLRIDPTADVPQQLGHREEEKSAERALIAYGDARLPSSCYTCPCAGLVFPSVHGKALNDATISKLIRDLGIAAVPHGFRSSFRDWAAERTNHPREVIEAALAHTVRNQTEAAYARSDLFERRRHLMNDWAAYLDGRRGQVIPLRR